MSKQWLTWSRNIRRRARCKADSPSTQRRSPGIGGSTVQSSGKSSLPHSQSLTTIVLTKVRTQPRAGHCHDTGSQRALGRRLGKQVSLDSITASPAPHNRRPDESQDPASYRTLSRHWVPACAGTTTGKTGFTGQHYRFVSPPHNRRPDESQDPASYRTFSRRWDDDQESRPIECPAQCWYKNPRWQHRTAQAQHFRQPTPCFRTHQIRQGIFNSKYTHMKSANNFE